jgi:D-serine deaminase-like pyridoxal phosphate-dependent protein
MIDHEDHVKLLEEHAARTGRQGTPWKAFIKIDIGSHRAGVENSSSRLDALIAQANASSHVDIYGIYCHAGHSYASKTTEDAVKVLEQEFGGVFEASKKLTLKAGQEVVLSIGATPTAHVVSHLQKSVPAGMTLELHAGNFPANDLQQFATGLVAESDQAVRVLAEVCSVYPERNEALINAGVLALTREPGPISGLARLTGDKFDWSILRVSQEHGILGWAGDAEKKQKAEDVFSIGQRLLLYTQHACITSAMYHIYYVVDEDDIVRETWTPWKGW